MQPVKYGKSAGLIVLLAMQAGFGATFTVAKDGSGQFTTVQAAIQAAGQGDEVVILDAGRYAEQVTIDSTKNGLVLRSENPLAASRPTIVFQDKINLLTPIPR